MNGRRLFPLFRALRPSVLAAAMVLACRLVGAAPAAAPEPIIGMQHSSWTAQEGAPTGITGIAQTPDGWLWIGSSVGLFRFDGVRFQRAAGEQAQLSSSIAGLGLLPDGTLWVGYKYGGASVMAGGRMRHFRVGEQGMPGGAVLAMGRDADGRLWLGGRGLYLLGDDGAWRKPAAAMGAPETEVIDLLRDRGGVLWVRASQAIYTLAPHAARFELHREPVQGYGKLALHPNGSVWSSDMLRPGLHWLAGPPGSERGWDTQDKISAFGFDDAGNLWQPDYSGVARVAGAGGRQRTGAEQGLSGVHGIAVFQDRERNIWIGTENGLDRFRDYRLAPLALPRYISGARPLAARARGGAWVDRYAVAGPDAAPVAFAPPASVADLTSALHEAPDGRLWSGGIGGLWLVRDGRREAVPLPPGLAEPMRAPVLSMASDGAGALWVSLGRRGLYTLRDGVWLENGGVSGLAGLYPPVVAGDGRRMWFGATGDRLVVLEGGALRRYGSADGLRLGTVLAILPTADGAWVGGENGIAYVDGRRVLPITGRGGDPFAGTTGLVPAADGTLWINGGAGISAIAPDQLRRALTEPGYRVQFARYDYRDGLQGTASPITPMPSAVRGSDGRLWFSTMGGTYCIDPAALPRNRHVPPVYITGLSANGRDYAALEGMRLPPHSRELNLEFTALSLRAPERMAFRYQLEGVDHGWQDASGQRSAHYTNLAPGSYRFRVLASNDDGVWNEQGAALSFQILPGLEQTAWFRVLCGLAVLGALWLLHVLRLRRVAHQVAARMNGRLAERERIARELHDTLLQSVYGLILKMGVAVRRLPPAQRQPLEEALDAANALLEEGRDRVAGLRGAAPTTAALAHAIRDFGAPLAQERGISFDVTPTGEAVALEAGLAGDVLAICREAVWNALLHAQARAISVSLALRDGRLLLAVADDGRGMPPEVMRTGTAAGHWGIRGMRERAAAIGRLELASGPGGTTWTLSLPLPAAQGN
ncbi:triple tyrosine motif-containing protein [Oxalobacteraceae bacterium A2-2]